MVAGLIGIIIAVVLFMFLIYKGFNVLYVGPLCALIVALTNTIEGMTPVTAITQTFVGGITSSITSLFSMLFFGAIFGKIMQDTGGTTALLRIFTKNFIFKTENKKSQIRRAVLSIIIISAMMTWGGIDAYTQLFITFACGMIIAKQIGLPRRCVPSFMTLGCAFIAAPAAPQVYNQMTMAGFMNAGIMDTKVTYGAFPGMVAVLIVAAGGFWFCQRFCIKCLERGETFDWGPVQPFNTGEEEKNLPPFILSVIPLALVFVLYTIVGLDVMVALVCGIIAAILLLGKYIDISGAMKIDKISPLKQKLLSIRGCLNAGADRFPSAMFTLTIASGLAAVVTATNAFGDLIGLMSGIQIHPVILTLICMWILTAITSNPVASLMIVLPLVLGILQAQGTPINAPMLFRVAAIAATTFETLPCNGTPLLNNMLCGTTHKEAYFPVFMQSCIFTFIASIVCGGIAIALY